MHVQDDVPCCFERKGSKVAGGTPHLPGPSAQPEQDKAAITAKNKS